MDRLYVFFVCGNHILYASACHLETEKPMSPFLFGCVLLLLPVPLLGEDVQLYVEYALGEWVFCLVDLTGKVFVFYSLLNMMLAMEFYLFMGFVTLREFPFISSIFFKS